MNAADTKKALLTAQRAYERAMRAKTCGEAANNLRLGQKWEQRGREGVRALIPQKLEYRHYSPMQRELFELQQLVPAFEWRAHEHRLKKCGLTQLQYEHAYWEDRARSEGAADRASERQYRKRPKKR